jgi:threonine dehydrogenase-like Zn-dependent dehydrogenase
VKEREAHVGQIKVIAGPFRIGNMTRKTLYLWTTGNKGMLADVNVPVTQIASVEVATEENVKKVGGALGWGAAGAVIAGPVGLLAGAILGGRGKDVTFIVTLRDNRRFMATASSGTYKEFLAATFKS